MSRFVPACALLTALLVLVVPHARGQDLKFDPSTAVPAPDASACARVPRPSLGVRLLEPGPSSPGKADPDARPVPDDPPPGGGTGQPVGDAAGSTLRGSGDLVVTVPIADLRAARNCARARRMTLRLLVNGVDMGPDNQPVEERVRASDSKTAAEDGMAAPSVDLRFRIKPDEWSKRLWANLYRSSGLTRSVELDVALGLHADTPLLVMKAVDAGRRPRIAVTSMEEFWMAVLLAVFILFFALVVALRTGALRDTARPPEHPASADSRPTYSLARTQLWAWFVFAIVAAVFLRVVYGQLPPLDDSLLVLLGISVGTAGVSMSLDRAEPSAFTPSQGFFKDLVIGGASNKDQIHRYQAVVVNVFLLLVGAAHVIRQVSYPLFDDTWLWFLGVSGAAYAGGKRIVEKQ